MNFKEQDKILELKGELIILKEKYNNKVKEYKELQKKYINLRARYTIQADELLRLKIQISKEVKDDN
jgi:hypothetical protein